MTLAEFFGYLASVLVFLSFYMRTMVALRCVAILSNFAFITYASLEDLLPVLILHILLLPTNIYRLHQIQRLLRDIAASRDTGFPLEPLIPFMRERPIRRGEVLFRKGDPSAEMFYLAKGRVRILEVGALLQPGEIFGEISLFAPDNRRTGTAVAEDAGSVFSLSERAVLQILYQNPQLGFSLIRIVTRRLIDNFHRLEQALQERAGQGDGAAAVVIPPGPALPDVRKAEEADAVVERTRQRRRVAQAVVVLIPIALLLATIHSQRSYFGSVLFRDAVVTSWVYTATAPISGQVEAPVPKPGDIVAGGDAVVTMRDRQTDDREVARLEAESAHLERRIEQLEAQLATLQRTSAQWRARSDTYAAVFKETIGTGLSGLEQKLAFVEKQLALSDRLARRVKTLAGQGHASHSSTDERLAEVMELESRRSELEKEIALTRHRAQAAEAGVFIMADGSNPDWVFDSSDVLDLRLIEAADALADAEGALARVVAERRSASELLRRVSEAEVGLPPGSLVWSVTAAPGATVARGGALLEWIDCRRPLVDVPVSEIDLAMIREGATVDVWIDGFYEPLAGEVIYRRGAAARLERRELAAIADGPGSTRAQVLVALEEGRFDAESCPVGRAAFVDFPDIRPLTRLMESLRM